MKSGEEERILRGHPWVFDNEIGRFQGDCPDGQSAEVLTKSGMYLGTGIPNRKSKITVRIFSRDRAETIDRAFFARRIRSALEYRLRVYAKSDSFRLLFAEADLVPGLIVDRFVTVSGKVFLSAQFLTLGVESFREDILSALRETVPCEGIFERSDVHVRALEGLEERKGWVFGSGDPVIEILENGIRLEVDLENGQKTGYFLDQKHNRALIASLSKGLSVLDTFTHTGAFGLNAASGGASSVISVDISAEAVAMVDRNIRRNGFESLMSAQTADVFDLLKDYEKEGRKFDLIILDPPAFTKSAKMVEKAYGGYKEINLRAMKLLRSGGYLMTCSCSHFFGSEIFYRMIGSAAVDAHRTVQILERRGPGPDHPSLLGYPESEYLKCALLRVW